MFKKLVPDFFVPCITDIDLDVLKNRGITAVILDLDNTLDSHHTKTPSAHAQAFLNSLSTCGFSVCVISNGKEARVNTYLQNLAIPYVANAGKPLKKSYQKALHLLNSSPDCTAFIGDQIFTDVWGANRMGLVTILTEPIEQFENAFFYIKRFFEGFIKSKLPRE